MAEQCLDDTLLPSSLGKLTLINLWCMSGNFFIDILLMQNRM